MGQRCPFCGRELVRSGDLLLCQDCAISFPVGNFIPVGSESPPARHKRSALGHWLLAIAVMCILYYAAAGLSTSVSETDGRARPTTEPLVLVVVGQTHRRMPSDGHGKLTVENGTDSDGFVRVAPADSDKAVYAGGVRAGQQLVLRAIEDGAYEVFFCTGTQWASDSYSFRDDYRCHRFTDRFRCKTVPTQSGVRWTDWSITLHTVVGGDAPATSISPGEPPTLE